MSDYIEVNLPTWALCAIVNDDYSGLSDEDETQVRKFVAKHGDVFDSDETVYFHWNPAFGAATSCILAKFPMRP
jgi:hypothetical protein